MTPSPDDIGGKLFLGRLSETLSNLIEAQSADVFAANGLLIPVKSCSLMLTVEALEPASAIDLARALDCSHQLVLQKTPKLTELGMVVRVPCPDDRRRKLFSLTDRGREQLALFRSLEPRFVTAYNDLEAAIGDIHTVLQTSIAALRQRPLEERMGGRRSS